MVKNYSNKNEFTEREDYSMLLKTEVLLNIEMYSKLNNIKYPKLKKVFVN